jgi:putative endonuclease
MISFAASTSTARAWFRGFTKRYRIKVLVHFECYDTPSAAIQREKNIKHWPRAWKLDLVNSANPQWRDLYSDIRR